MRAYCALRADPWYRKEAFISGLRTVGCEIVNSPNPAPGNLLLIWNRYGQWDELATRYERAGGLVIVAENGYLGRDAKGGPWYSLAFNRHNGCGTWPETAGRFEKLGITFAPWRSEGRHVVILASRSIGVDPYREPPGWSQRIRTDRKIIFRMHPGSQGNNEASDSPNAKSLEKDLANAWACITWGSGAAIKALVSGVPVFHGLKGWIAEDASKLWPADIEQPFLGDRRPAFERIAQSVWTLEEINGGVPFQRLIIGSSRAADRA